MSKASCPRCDCKFIVNQISKLQSILQLSKNENARLKELNREMVEVLKFAHDNLTFLITDSSEFDFIEVRKAIKEVLAKADGEKRSNARRNS